jgi:hypothetical protein
MRKVTAQEALPIGTGLSATSDAWGRVDMLRHRISVLSIQKRLAKFRFT